MRQKTTTICYLANADNYHTYKWASQFSLRGYGVHVFSLEECRSEAIRELKNVTVHYLQNPSARQGSELQKLGYLSTVGVARRLIEELDPDVVHAHYASSYGLVASLACRRPYYLSVWGSDVYDFPRKSPLHRAVVRRSLAKPAWLMSTSRAMAEECAKYTGRDFEITPFGVDMGLFSPRKREPHEGLVVGTVKALERKYGIDTLLRGCALLHDRRPDLGVRVRIAGKGTMEAELKALATRLGMDGYLDWLGFIPQEEAAREWAGLDIAIVESESESESFGVSAVEAQASGTPLIISDIPGLMEACDGGHTAVVTPRRDPAALADALEALADDPARRARMGAEGRAYVERAYEVGACFDRVEEIYRRNMEEAR